MFVTLLPRKSKFLIHMVECATQSNYPSYAYILKWEIVSLSSGLALWYDVM